MYSKLRDLEMQVSAFETSPDDLVVPCLIRKKLGFCNGIKPGKPLFLNLIPFASSLNLPLDGIGQHARHTYFLFNSKWQERDCMLRATGKPQAEVEGGSCISRILFALEHIKTSTNNHHTKQPEQNSFDHLNLQLVIQHGQSL